MKGMRQHRMTFHKRTQAADDFEPSDEVSTEVCEVRASLEAKGGSEPETGDRQSTLATYTITLRWGPTIAAIDSTWWATRDNQLTGETERFNFTSVSNVGERNREVVIEAVRA